MNLDGNFPANQLLDVRVTGLHSGGSLAGLPNH
jgi:hypothetical protein